MRKVALFLSLIMCVSMFSCKKNDLPAETVIEDEGCEMLVLASSTPGSLVSPLLEYYNNEFKNTYTVSVSTAADNMMISANGDYDLAVLPLNMAFYLHDRSDGNNQIMGITGQGGISLIGINTEFNDFSDLNDKKIYSIKDTVMNYVFSYISAEQGITAELNYVSSYTELIEMFKNGGEVIALCEEPYVNYLASVCEISHIADINELWKEVSGAEYDIPTEVLVVNRKFANANGNAVANISEDYSFVVSNYNDCSEYIIDSGVTEGIELSIDDISDSSPIYIYGEEMIAQINEFSLLIEAFDPDFTCNSPIDTIYYK